jgi:hypothetical protein
MSEESIKDELYPISPHETRKNVYILQHISGKIFAVYDSLEKAKEDKKLW